MALLRIYLRRELKELLQNGIRLRVIGDRTALSSEIRDLIAEAERQTSHNEQLQLVMALNYGGRNEILAATRRIAEQVRDGLIAIGDIDERLFASHLDTAGLPDPDLIIRTSGERRLSNFLLWQCAYAELVFTPTLWPDFAESDLDAAIDDYHRRERRYGGAGG